MGKMHGKATLSGLGDADFFRLVQRKDITCCSGDDMVAGAPCVADRLLTLPTNQVHAGKDRQGIPKQVDEVVRVEHSKLNQDRGYEG
jgi:hypothetical protein